MMAYIDTKYLGKCETCRHHRSGSCNTFCDCGEEYSPDLSKIPTADDVPKSEVEELIRENESLAKTVNEASELIRKLRINIYELKKDRYQVLPDGRIELIPRTDIDEIKREVAREIFEEIEQWFDTRIDFYEKMKFKASLGFDKEQYEYAKTIIANLKIYRAEFAELKKKHTEG
jgi:hypothetical protein